MSSHHIVRDEQEPALLLLGTHEGLVPIARQLLEWSPTLAVAAPALELALMMGIKFDMVICKEPEIPKLREDLLEQAPLKFLSVGPAENYPETCLAWLVASTHSGVNILADSFPEASHWTPFLEQMDVAVFTPEIKWTYIRKGHYEKWVPANTAFHWDDPGLISHGLSENRISLQEGMVKISAPTAFWLGESGGEAKLGN
jgi:thiamine pyrophosphokinase